MYRKRPFFSFQKLLLSFFHKIQFCSFCKLQIFSFPKIQFCFFCKMFCSFCKIQFCFFHKLQFFSFCKLQIIFSLISQHTFFSCFAKYCLPIMQNTVNVISQNAVLLACNIQFFFCRKTQTVLLQLVFFCL